MRTRFAPSPTGLLHLGHAYAAQYAYKLATQNNGTFLLRFEDIDITRVRPRFYSQIEEDLTFLGIVWNEKPFRQSDRLNSYALALKKLKSKGLVYPCFCTRKEVQHELNLLTRAPHGPEGSLYPGTCKKLTQSEVQTKQADGLEPSWRFDSAKAAELYPALSFTDSIVGKTKVHPQLLGDVILARKDIGTSYHIAVVVDDAMQKISDITRGKDLMHSTHIHRILQTALGLPTPLYHHHKLILDTSGKRLAKRDQSQSILQMRQLGMGKNDILQQLEVHL